MSEITNPNIARAVLAAAKENSVWESPIPSEDAQLLKDANFVYEQADAAWNNNMRGKAVTAVKFAVQVDGAHRGKDIEPDDDEDLRVVREILSQTVPRIRQDIDDYVEASDIDFIESLISAEKAGKKRRGVLSYAEQAIEDAYKEPDETGEIESGDRGGDHGSGSVSPWVEPDKPKTVYDERFEAEEFAKAQAKKLNLPVPNKVDDVTPSLLTTELAQMSIQKLAVTLNESQLCLAAATWQAAISEIDEEHAKRVGNHYFNKEYADAIKNSKNKEEAVAKAEAVPQVKEWRDKEAAAEARRVTFRSLKEIYSGTHNTISRIFAMKQEERERGY